MWHIILGIFFILHGAVHMLWVVLSQGWIKEGEIPWTGESWLFSNILSEKVLSNLITVMFIIATLLFIISGIVFMTEVEWKGTLLIVTAIVSSVIILLFWDGTFKHLDAQGFIGVGINIIILILILTRVIVD